MDVRISVIIPIYNVERYIRECLQSVARQSFSAYEVLMVDDGSTDQSGRIAPGICRPLQPVQADT